MNNNSEFDEMVLSTVRTTNPRVTTTSTITSILFAQAVIRKSGLVSNDDCNKFAAGDISPFHQLKKRVSTSIRRLRKSNLIRKSANGPSRGSGVIWEDLSVLDQMAAAAS